MGWDQIDEGALKEISSALQMDPATLISMIFTGRMPRGKVEKMRWANQKIVDELPERNRHMCQVIEKNRAVDRRIYVIAGSGHLSSPKEKLLDVINTKPQEVAYQETLDYLKTKKFAILIPK